MYGRRISYFPCWQCHEKYLFPPSHFQHIELVLLSLSLYVGQHIVESVSYNLKSLKKQCYFIEELAFIIYLLLFILYIIIAHIVCVINYRCVIAIN